MPMKSIIRVENLSKQYRLGRRRVPYATLRDKLAEAARAPFKSFRGNGDREEETIWALRDVNFEVKPGEVLGVIGRNGAGKSTLLKVLSRVTEPTSGQVDLFGRVGSLLEVGTGFHGELSGRDNIFLNGAILGMRRAEILRKFDEIVAFAEVEKFIDTPVKHYSSGMYTRLAFSVAAHLESEIILVDEVLAVGDANFQNKCLGKLEEVGSQGRTVLFISHSMQMILRLCSRVMLLEGGHLIEDGTPTIVAKRYLHPENGSPAERIWDDPQSAPGDSVARLKAVRVRDQHGRVAHTVDISQPLSVEVEYWNLQANIRPTAILHFVDEYGHCLFSTGELNSDTWGLRTLEPGFVRAVCNVPGHFLAEGTIFLLAAVCSYNPNDVHALERDAVSFQVVDRTSGEGVRSIYVGDWPGLMRPMLDWRAEYLGKLISHQDGTNRK